MSADFLLKDNEESRKLQRQLFKEAEELVAKAKKKKRKSEQEQEQQLKQEEEQVQVKDESETPKLESKSAKKTPKRRSQAKKEEVKLEEDKADDPAEQEDEQYDDTPVPIPISDGIKEILELDYKAINRRRKLHRLPAEKSVASMLDDFVHSFGSDKLAQHEKTYCRAFSANYRKETAKESLENVLDQINLAKEVAEGLRVLTDFYLKHLLLYEKEFAQHDKLIKGKKFEDFFKNQRDSEVTISTPVPQVIFTRLRRSASSVAASDAASEEASSGRSSPSVASTAKSTSFTPSSSVASPNIVGDTSKRVAEERNNLFKWTLLPDSLADKAKGQRPLASTVYGPVFLLRLMLKMPVILGKMRMGPKKNKMMQKLLQAVLAFLEKSYKLEDVTYA